MGKTVERPKRPIYPLDIDPELRKRIKAVASLHGKTMRDWVTEAILEKLEDDIDAREGLAVLGEVEGTISLITMTTPQPISDSIVLLSLTEDIV